MFYVDKSNIDSITSAVKIVTHEHHEVHNGSHFNLQYSVLSLGVASSPDDMMTLTFTTPNTTRWLHMTIAAISSSGARFRFIEGGTGGGTSPTGALTPCNSNRNSTHQSGVNVSYDATLVTGGTSCVDIYIGADGQGNSFAAGSDRGQQEWVLKQNTQYQLSIYEADNVPGTLQMSWYEHISR